MNLSNPTIRDSYKQLNLMYTAYLLGIILFSGFVLFTIIVNDGGYISNGNEIYQSLKIIFVILILTLIPTAFCLHKSKISKIDPKISLKDKLLTYRNSFIIKAGIIDFLGVVNVVMLFLYGDLYLLIPLVLLILYLGINRPGIGKICNELNLSPEETRLLRF